MSRHISYKMLYRLIGRSTEIAEEDGMNAHIVVSYNGLLVPDGTYYRKCHEAVTTCLIKANQVNLKEQKTLEAFDAPFRAARSMAVAFSPGTVVPETLKGQATDTDIRDAITTVLGIVQSHASEDWAKVLLDGPFGALAPKLLMEIKESIAADNALENARQERAKAYAPAYEKFLSFKDIVRNTLGRSSKYYRRLNLRSKSAEDDSDENEESEAKDAAAQKNEAPAEVARKGEAPAAAAKKMEAPAAAAQKKEAANEAAQKTEVPVTVAQNNEAPPNADASVEAKPAEKPS